MQEFVNEVVNGLKSKMTDCEITTFIKDMPNGLTKTGVTIKPNGADIAPTIYLDDFYKSNLPVKDTIDTIIDIYNKNKCPDFDIEWFKDFNVVKEHLVARLYNQTTKAEVFRSASEYGFDDLIIVPYINVYMGPNMNGSVKIMKQHLDVWGVSVDELMEIALSNIARKAKITSIGEYLAKISGMPEEVFSDVTDSMKVVTIEAGAYGAISAITCRSQLDEIFPDGYYLIPASIHECIAVPNDDRFVGITEMIKAINAECVSPEEILADHEYRF